MNEIKDSECLSVQFLAAAKAIQNRKPPIRTIFELNCHIQKTHVLTKFHEHWTKNVTKKKTAPPPGGHVFSPIWTIFELVQIINKTNVLTNFHDNWAKIVTSRVFTRKTAPPTGGNVFQHTGTIFELNQDIMKTNILTNFELGRNFIGIKLLTKFHEDGTRNVASRVFTSKYLRTDGWTYDGQRPVRKAHLSNQSPWNMTTALYESEKVFNYHSPHK
ncbi:hypothetical protein DPMN_129977 [Dreissena polymorpha]|uniref:Uncharacterized protein n=1 Tax=Dreissena polymorpha TaxID=45954 RepID=A0A9D4H5X7_DREPO|nr:hypothetical protein DPMN_129977 [Dreissena polymorpha]